MKIKKRLILASSSRFRQQQLLQLQLPFEAVSPDYDESPLFNENAAQTALRLAAGKANSVANQFPDGSN